MYTNHVGMMNPHGNATQVHTDILFRIGCFIAYRKKETNLCISFILLVHKQNYFLNFALNPFLTPSFKFKIWFKQIKFSGILPFNS